MATDKLQDDKGLLIRGTVEFDGAEKGQDDPGVYAHALDAAGAAIGSAPVSADGTFEMRVPLSQPADISIAVTPEADPADLRKSQSQVTAFKASDWQRATLQPKLRIPRLIWWPWRRIRVCVNGHIQKVIAPGVPGCPVPFVKVEVFDVDRESCWWPWLLRWEPHLIDPRVIDVPTLINPPVPPDPIGPVALAHIGDPAAAVGFNPQPDPPAPVFAEPIERVALNPQPLPPGEQVAGPTDPIPWSQAFSFESAGRGLARSAVAADVSAKLRDLTLTSRIAPWEILPLCFYSRQLVCTTFTDCNGDWECCFNWWPFHVRHGRFRFDPRPDIIIRVTQIINGVSTVIYMDPYSSTRWNVSGATINLSLNDPRVVCGPGCNSGPGLGNSQATLLQVGSDPTWTINQANGLYETGLTTNAAFGGALYLRGDFSLDLKTAGTLYYRLQWKPEGAADSSFQPIITALSALRATPFGAFSDYTLGPHTIAGVSGLYEVQDAFHWWLMPGVPGGPGTVIGLWDTAFESDEGSYVLRMDMFDAAGNPLATIQYPNHGGNGTGIDPAPPPIVVGQLDTLVHVDNKPVDYSLGVPAANSCGIIPWTPTLPATLTFAVHASQENGRVHEWRLDYTKGTTASGGNLGDVSYNGGLSPVNVMVPGGVMLIDPSTPSGYIESSCAFALRLQAWAHIRGNWGFIWYGEKLYAIAVERCTCPPVVA
ncbi:MAG TPA: hypothetical protein VH417_12980 [Vicinamibacterales bacterium]|jgi:hypothetical protein